MVMLALLAGRVAAQASQGLTLGGAARLAASQGAGLDAARRRVDAAKARVQQQHAELLPTISGVISEGDRTFNTATLGLALKDPSTGQDLFAPSGEVLGPVRTWDARGTVRQTIADVAAFARVRAARGAASAAAADASNASQQSAVAAAAAYVAVLRADALLAARETDSTLAADLLGLARNQLAAGTGIVLDVSRAGAQLAATRAQLIAARTGRERSRLQLQRMLGLPLGTPVVLVDSLTGTSEVNGATGVAEATTRALQARTDLRLMDAQVDAGARQLTAIRAERLPAVSAFADQGRIGGSSARLRTTYTWGVAVSVPVFDGGRREGRIAEQRSTVRELDARRRDLVQQVSLEVREALLDVASTREQVASAVERQALAAQELAQARGRYATGIAGNADVITALLWLNEARAQLVDARAAFQLAHVELARAQGVVTEMP